MSQTVLDLFFTVSVRERVGLEVREEVVEAGLDLVLRALGRRAVVDEVPFTVADAQALDDRPDAAIPQVEELH